MVLQALGDDICGLSCFPPLCRCFRTCQWLVQRGAQYRGHLAQRRLRTLRVCLVQWMEMKQLPASDVTRVTLLSLYWQKAGEPVANTESLLSNQSPLAKFKSPVKLRKNTTVGADFAELGLLGGGRNLTGTRHLGGVPTGSKPWLGCIPVSTEVVLGRGLFWVSTRLSYIAQKACGSLLQKASGVR